SWTADSSDWCARINTAARTRMGRMAARLLMMTSAPLALPSGPRHLAIQADEVVVSDRRSEIRTQSAVAAQQCGHPVDEVLDGGVPLQKRFDGSLFRAAYRLGQRLRVSHRAVLQRQRNVVPAAR